MKDNNPSLHVKLLHLMSNSIFVEGKLFNKYAKQDMQSK